MNASSKLLFFALALTTGVKISASLDIDTRLTNLENQIKEVRTETSNKNFGSKFATGAPQLKDSYGFFVEGGLTYLKAMFSQADYAISSDDSGKKVLRLAGFDDSFGYNLGVGLNSKYDDFYLTINNSLFSLISKVGTNQIISDDQNVATGDTKLSSLTQLITGHFSDANNSSFAAYNLLGLELGKNIFSSRFFSFDSSIGILNAWVVNRNKVLYRDGELKKDIKQRFGFYGLGPQIKLNPSIYLIRNFSIFSESKFALMWGPTRNQFEIADYNVFTETTSNNTWKNSYRQTVPYIHSILGFGYEYNTDEDASHFKFRLGYMVEYFIGCAQQIYPVQINDTAGFKKQDGNLETAGAIFDINWNF